MKFLDLLDEKIDYLFKHGKNADERCYDFFIRTVTFLLVTLIVLCYASFVHAAENYGTFFGGVQYDYFLNFNDVYNHYLEYDRQDTNFAMPSSGIGFVLSDPYSLGPFTTEESFNNIVNFVDTNYTITGNEEYQYSYTVLKRRDSWSNSGNSEFTITKFYSNSECFIVCNSSSSSISAPSYIVTNMDNSDMYIRTFSLNYISNSDFHVNFNSESIDNSYILDPHGQGELYFCDMPLYHMFYSNDGINGNYTYKTVDSMIDAIRSGDVTIQLNPYLDIFNPPVPEEVESNINHLYLNDIQIGLTSNNNNQSLLASEVVIGVDVDDWILNNIDDYSLLVYYNIHFKDTMPSNPNDPTGSTSVIVPLRSFYNKAYSYSVAEILRNIQVDGIGNFLNYYNDLNSGGVNVVSINTYNALLPSPLKELEYKLGQFWLNLYPESSTVNYTVFQFDLTVVAYLVDHVSDEKSSPYIKEFDFVHGAESVKSAEILRNNNPWTGGSTPQQSPIVPSGSGSMSGGNGGGNVNVTVNNEGNHKIPLNVHTKKELNDTINNYGEITDTFFDTYKDLTDETKEDGYISLLRQTLPEVSKNVPIIDFMLKCAICVIALGVIIFVLKVLLF